MSNSYHDHTYILANNLVDQNMWLGRVSDVQPDAQSATLVPRLLSGYDPASRKHPNISLEYLHAIRIAPWYQSLGVYFIKHVWYAVTNSGAIQNNTV